jgi:hypothetical protein
LLVNGLAVPVDGTRELPEGDRVEYVGYCFVVEPLSESDIDRAGLACPQLGSDVHLNKAPCKPLTTPAAMPTPRSAVGRPFAQGPP